jgi:hypothetical protein
MREVADARNVDRDRGNAVLERRLEDRPAVRFGKRTGLDDELRSGVSTTSNSLADLASGRRRSCDD